MARALLIRHGESVANAGGRTSDVATIRLTERGHAQARTVAEFLHDRPPTRIVTSPYVRTKETAAPALEMFSSVPIEEWEVHEFTYLSLSSFAETTHVERRPMVDAFWARQDPEWVDGAGAESVNDLLRRVEHFLRRLRTCGRDELVAVYTHGQFMRATMWAIREGAFVVDAAGMARLRAFDASVPIPNCAVVELVTNGETVDVSEVITTHLPPALAGERRHDRA